jgi:hypothetical protein
MTETTAASRHHFNGPDVEFKPRALAKQGAAKLAETPAGQVVRRFLEKRERGIIGS